MLSDLIEDEKKTEVPTEPVPEPVKEIEKLSLPEKPVEKVKPATQISDEQMFILEPENGIYFRVQLAAGHKPVDIPKYFNRLSVKENVKMEYHEGWRKYTVGSFEVYGEARDHKIGRASCRERV